MSEPVVIGIREVYDAVTQLSSKLDGFITMQAVTAATTELRLANLEKQLEGERNRRWALWLALIGVIVSIGMGIISFVVS